jgi:hypothetical protein
MGIMMARFLGTLLAAFDVFLGQMLSQALFKNYLSTDAVVVIFVIMWEIEYQHALKREL